jgi:hypothetical protein
LNGVATPRGLGCDVFFPISSATSKEMTTMSYACGCCHLFELCCCYRRMMMMSYIHRCRLFFQYSSIASKET